MIAAKRLTLIARILLASAWIITIGYCSYCMYFEN